LASKRYWNNAFDGLSDIDRALTVCGLNVGS
jgi:hypothetical protein